MQSKVEDVHTFLRALDRKIEKRMDEQNENISNIAEMISLETEKAKGKFHHPTSVRIPADIFGKQET